MSDRSPPRLDPVSDGWTDAVFAVLGLVRSVVSEPGDPDRAAFDRRLAALSPALDAALAADRGDSSRMRMLRQTAVETADAGDIGKALAILDRLPPLIEAAAGAAPGGIASGIVEKRRFLATRWGRIPTGIAAEIARLRTAMIAEVPEEDPAALTADIEAALNAFSAEMRDALDDAINAGDGTYARAIGLIDGFVGEVRSHALVRHLGGNPFDPSVDVAEVLTGALIDMKTTLAA